MTKSFKKRWKIIQSEIIDRNWDLIYSESSIKNLMKARYKHWEIKTNNSYIYQKMNKLLDNKVYMEVWNMPKDYANSCWYINIFELHKKLTDIIKICHLPRINSRLYTKEEREYMRLLRLK